jgi:perosamine synthetase
MSNKFIPQVEPYITDAEKTAVAEYLDSGGWLTEFRKTREFEELLARTVGTRCAVVVTSGTVALYSALLAAGIGPGARVAVPNYTMIATVNAVLWAGAEPILRDVDPETLCLSLESLERGAPPDVLLYVSIGGRSGNMNQVLDYCEKNGVVLIEDACQALCSNWMDRPLGTFGKLGAYSFTPHKIITTGQGGAVVTDDEELCGRVRKLKDFSRIAPGVDRHDGLGFNFKFTDLQAVIGIEQLKTIEFRVSSRREILNWYRQGLEDLEGTQMLKTDLGQTTPWFVEIVLESEQIRDDLAAHLKKNGFGSRPFYPPINHQPMFVKDYPPGTFPVSESIAPRGLWLPSSIGLDRRQVTSVCEAISTYFRERA